MLKQTTQYGQKEKVYDFVNHLQFCKSAARVTLVLVLQGGHLRVQLLKPASQTGLRHLQVFTHLGWLLQVLLHVHDMLL